MQIGADFEGLLEIHVQKYRKLYTAIDNGANEILQQNRHFSLRSMFCISCFFSHASHVETRYADSLL